jgi:hypothetical protein
MAGTATAVSTGLSLTPETNDNELFKQLTKLYNAVNALTASVNEKLGYANYKEFERPDVDFNASCSVAGVSHIYIPAALTMPAGTAINLYNASGTLKAQKAASIDGTRPCNGFTLEEATAVDQFIKVLIGPGIVPYISGLTKGSVYYISPVAGLVTDTPPVVTGTIKHAIGFAVADTYLMYIPNMSPIVNP